MVRNVRNWWIDLDVDGRHTQIRTGPPSREGGFAMTIYQRDGGNIERALEINGYANRHGELILYVRDGTGRHLAKIESKRDGVPRVGEWSSGLALSTPWIPTIDQLAEDTFQAGNVMEVLSRTWEQDRQQRSRR